MESYFQEYAESHQNPVNLKLHKVCVPAITWSLLGALHSIPVSGDIRASHIFAFLALLFYATFRKPLFFALMFLATVLIFWSFQFVPHLLIVSIIVFTVAWVGQFYGHHVEGKKPSFLKDIFFLLIGPLWVLNKVLPKKYRV